MTPSLQQAIKLLQMTRLELQNTLSEELEENPVLEEGDQEYEEGSESSDEKEEAKKAEEDDKDPMEEIDFEAYFNDFMDGGASTATRTEIREAPPIENTLSRDPDLYDHLLWQLHMTDVPARRREIAELIVGNLNPDGFLVATLEELQALGGGEHGGEPYAEEEVVAALELVRSFDPPGVGCHDLQECLIRQIDIARANGSNRHFSTHSIGIA